MVKVNSTMDILTKPEADLVINYAIDRKKKGLYSLILISGLPGSGKSSSSIRIGEKITNQYSKGENFFGAENVVDNFLDFINFVRHAKPSELNICVVEEISVLFPSRRAMSADNVDLAKILDTCRKKQVIIIANAPIWKAIDSHMRSMGNIYIQTLRVYKMASIVVSKFYRLQTDPRTGKTYTHSFKRNGRVVKKMYTKMPNKEEWAKYEGKKNAFLEELYSKVKRKAEERKKKEGGRSLKNTSIETLDEDYKKIYYLKYVEKLKGFKIAEKMGLSAGRISQMLAKIKEFKEIQEKS